MNYNSFNTIYKELADLIGIENTLKLNSIYGGQQISFPKKIISSKYCEEQIRLEYDGNNLKQLSKKYGYTERWIRSILKNK